MGILSGCNTDIISYNREFRNQGMQQYGKAAYADAASSFSNALRHEPGDYVSRFYLGASEEQMGKLQQAIHQYRTTLDVMNVSLEGKGDAKFRAKVINTLASSISREADRSGDLAEIEKAPRSAENSFLLAKIYRQTGDADSAITRFEQAQQLDPKNPDIASEYGLYLEQLGQTQHADHQLRRAYTLNSNDEQVQAALRRLGIVPGPSIKGEDGLEKPFIPLGPLPEMDLSNSNKSPAQPQQVSPTPPGQTAPGPVGTTGSPRD
jgi:Flp pilus assembly protein TadD